MSEVLRTAIIEDGRAAVFLCYENSPTSWLVEKHKENEAIQRTYVNRVQHNAEAAIAIAQSRLRSSYLRR